MKQKKDETPKVPAPRNMVAYLTWTEGTGSGVHPAKKKEQAKGTFKHPKKEFEAER